MVLQIKDLRFCIKCPHSSIVPRGDYDFVISLDELGQVEFPNNMRFTIIELKKVIKALKLEVTTTNIQGGIHYD